MALLRPLPFTPGHRLHDGDFMNKVAMEPAYSFDTAIVAEGVDQLSSYYLEATTNVITGGASGTGVRLPYPKPCWAVEIYNTSGSSKTVYPHFPSNETINGLPVLGMPDGSYVRLFCTGTSWVGFLYYVGGVADRTAVRMQAQWDIGSVVQNGTFYFCFDTPYAGTINSLRHVCGTGSFTIAVELNGTPVLGLAAISPTTVPTTTNATGANTFAAGQSIMGVISAASGSPTNALLSLNVSWSG